MCQVVLQVIITSIKGHKDWMPFKFIGREGVKLQAKKMSARI